MNAPRIHGFRTDNRSTQTRFHFHADRCVGCHACEVACSEQNALPVGTAWRRVGEVEAGTFPDTVRLHISSGCNHCLDAACVKGCPVDAYQVNERGVVLHLDDVCIGCQYCTWNCPYGVPVYQPDRRIVTKCDLCTHRLDQGLDPACVQACPADAIEVETVPLQQVLEGFRTDGAGPDMPDPGLTMPSTRITLPNGVDPGVLRKVDRDFVHPEDPHTSLVFMTVFTQLGLGGVAAVFLADVARCVWRVPLLEGQALGWLAPALMATIAVSLGASTLHLGRPFYAYRALRNWRTSWLSREVAGLTAFTGAGLVYAFLLLADARGLAGPLAGLLGEGSRLVVGGGTVAAGMVGVFCSSRLYRVPARPAWDTPLTTADFFLVAWTLGAATLAAAIAWSSLWWPLGSPFVRACAQAAGGSALLGLWAKGALQAGKAERWSASGTFELAASADLYRCRFARLRRLSTCVALAGAWALLPVVTRAIGPGSAAYLAATTASLVLLTAYCLAQRHLFFVTVVPRNMPGNFLMAAHRAVGRGAA